MGDKLRKTQNEIDRTLKRVEEGIADFDALIARAEDVQTPAHKEKLEVELKREIKKLQRLREQIKTWHTSSEIKDKAPLEDARKSIEKAMEKFKSCERSFKTKAFSKEGLAQASKADPTEIERDRHRKWIKDSLEAIADQIDSHETEIEKLTKKGKVKEAERVAQLEGWISVHRWHSDKLEQVLRRLENDDVELCLLDDVQNQVTAYLENYSDPNYVHDEEIFGLLGLYDEPSDTETSLIVTQTQKNSSQSRPEPPSILDASQAKNDMESGQEEPTLTTKQRETEDTTSPPLKVADESRKPTDQSQPDVAAPPSGTKSLSLSSGSVEHTVPLPHSSRPLAAVKKDESLGGSKVSELPRVSYAAATRGWRVNKEASTTAKALPPSAPPAQSIAESVKKAQQDEPEKREAGVQMLWEMENDVLNTKAAQADLPNHVDFDALAKVVEKAYENLPSVRERRHFRYYQSKVPWDTAPPSFPKAPLKDFATPEFFSDLSTDSLFFVFQHQPGTYQQYLAAKNLKQRGWRFHNKFLTWFRPNGTLQPMPADKGLVGPWHYFDHDEEWSTRAKDDFAFEYVFLENDLPTPVPATAPSGRRAPGAL